MNEQSRTVEAVQTAIQMEIDGKRYYQQASRTSKNELGKKLFQQLAKEEDFHRQKFEIIYQSIQAKKAWPEVEIALHRGKELKTLLADASQKVKAAKSELEAVQTAMTMENKTRDFYRLQAETANFPAERNYYQSLEKEESAHHASLLDYFEYLKDPVGWFTVKEHHSLDGG